MEHTPTILVPLDGSSFGEAILHTVNALARPLGARVLLLLVGDPVAQPDHAAPEAGPGGATDGDRATTNGTQGTDASAPAVMVCNPPLRKTEQALHEYLMRIAQELTGIQTRLVVDFADDPAGVIIARAREAHADLIAMTTHGRTGLGHLLAGSVCERVIRSRVAPVVVLRP
jgi:nucleotide-binding universal stress UspA family protein